MSRYDQCDDTCTVDCGHCKGAGRPVPVDLTAVAADLTARLEAATPGRWYAWDRGVGWHIAIEDPEPVEHLPGRPILLPEGYKTDIGRAEDAAAIVALWNAAPALLDERAALRAEVAELRAQVADADAARDLAQRDGLAAADERDELRAKVAAVEALADEFDPYDGIGPLLRRLRAALSDGAR